MSEFPCPECGTIRTDSDSVCPACGAPPVSEHRQGEVGEVRQNDLEPYTALRYIARLFKILAALMIIMMIGEVITGFVTDGKTAIATLLGEATRLLVLAGLLWAGGDVMNLLIEAGHDLRVTRILLGRVNARIHQSPPAESTDERNSSPAEHCGGAAGSVRQAIAREVSSRRSWKISCDGTPLASELEALRTSVSMTFSSITLLSMVLPFT